MNRPITLPALALSLCAASAHAQYCIPSYDATDDWIERVAIQPLASSTSGPGGAGYEDFSASLQPLGLGQSYDVEVDVFTQYQSGGEFRLDMWIDYDGDQVFEPEEMTEISPPRFYTSNSLHTRSAAFTVPANAALNSATRMRVSFRFIVMSGQPDPCSPCGTPCFGQVEDHGVRLTESTSNYCDVSPNSADSFGAVIAATGSTSVTANSMNLSAAQVPNTPGIFFFGSQQINVPFGAGRRCVGGQTKRLLPPVQGSSNQASRALDFTGSTSENIIQGGETWHFQYWFRDPMLGGFNLTDATTVDFVP